MTLTYTDDPDFPDHKANHRRYLQDPSRYKEVIPIPDEDIQRKIHSTWRLQYLKDVVLARILDDPTFSVLNSLIFFNQVDIVSYLQSDAALLRDLFGIIDSPEQPPKRKKDAVEMIQQCCAIAKSLQPPARSTLYTNFIQHGLLRVITYALSNKYASTRVAGTDILVAMIDHDPSMVRAYVFKSITERQTPLTDTLIELLLVEDDIGVKAQAADAIKVLLEPQAPAPPPQEPRQNGEYLSKLRATAQSNNPGDAFIHKYYEVSASKLFRPLKDLEKRKSCMLTPQRKVAISSDQLIIFSGQPFIARNLPLHSPCRDTNVPCAAPSFPKQILRLYRRSCIADSPAFIMSAEAPQAK